MKNRDIKKKYSGLSAEDRETLRRLRNRRRRGVASFVECARIQELQADGRELKCPGF